MKKSRSPVLSLFLLFALPLWGDSAIELNENGYQGLMEGNYREALDNFRQALAINPAYVDANKGIGESYFFLQEYEEALKYALIALTGASRRVDILTLIGRIYLAKNNIPEGERYLQQALAIEPYNQDAKYGMAEVAVFKGDYDSGKKVFEDSLTVNPNSRRSLLSLALLYEDEGDYAQASYYVKLVMDYFPLDIMVLSFAIEFYLRNREYSSAEELIYKWIALTPEDGQIPLVLGKLYMNMGRYSEAAQQFEEATRLDRDSYYSWYMLGQVYIKLGRYEEAVFCFKTINILDPAQEIGRLAMEALLLGEFSLGHPERQQAAQYHFDRGKRFERAYQYKQAFESYRRGRILSPLNLDGWYAYAKIQRSLGYTNRYRYEMEALQEAGYRDPDFLQTMELLEATEDNSLLSTWDGDLVYNESPLVLGLYFAEDNSSLIHPGLEDPLSKYLEKSILVNSHIEVRDRGIVKDVAEAYRLAQQKKLEIYLVFSVQETERTIQVSYALYLARTGKLIGRFDFLRSGNGRLQTALTKGAEEIIKILPLKAHLMGLEKSKVLFDIGILDGINPGDELVLVKRGKALWSDGSSYLEVAPGDILGKVVVSEVQENYSVGTLERNSPFDLVNLGDELFQLPEGLNISNVLAPLVNEELKAKLLRIH